ncbi:type VI secretion system Vgr family protein [Pseudomonas sp. G(2018)]|uniref:type VI secretion system Vgr family protein n=1 Tax=Pseudomonas sp. G(2018) TaxID=2502242 RepID=UPI0010F72778
MNTTLPVFFDHSRHKLWVSDLQAPLDVLAFHGQERLSQPFSYHIEFTSTEQDIAAEHLLGKSARFSLYALPKPVMPWETPEVKPLRTLNGVITAFKRLSASLDEARYELTLQPRLALLGRGRQFRIYQHQSVPQIVEHILRSRHEFEYQDFLFRLVRDYPKREQVMQYGESDLAFIARLLAEVGIWYRFTRHERLNIDVVEFCDDQRGYQFDIELPYRPPAGLSSGEDGVWQLQSSHRVVEKNLHLRAYDPRNANAWLQSDVDQTRGAKTTYGEAYHYAEPYTVLGDRYLQDEDLQSESGYFYARLRHERYLNAQTLLSGTSSSATLAPGQVLSITGGAPQAFAPRAVITHITTRAARDASFECSFEAIPYAETICFRPPLLPKPNMAGTVPARVTSGQAHDKYAEIDKEGRYKVNFLFDRDDWKLGEESLWLRLARPYAGDTFGLHLPLICGTEVAIAFEHGDPDRPYIAHALHDSEHPDHVTLAKRDYTRNVLRTPANNKLRMEDWRGQEHVKLSTEYGGKSQLNLGHLVDAEKKKRGEGFELRTDDWGALRAGKGLFISADEQIKAQGEQLDMSAAIVQLEAALSLARSLAQAARNSEVTPGDTESQKRLNEALKGLAEPGVLLHAPAGVGVLSPKTVCVASGTESVGVMAAHNVDLSAGHDITGTAEGGVSLFAQQKDLQLKSAYGMVELHALKGLLHALAKADVKIESVDGRVEITARDEVLLRCGSTYLSLKDTRAELAAPVDSIFLRAIHVQKLGGTSVDNPATALPSGYSAGYILHDEAQAAMPFTRYRITTQQGDVFNGVTDKDGKTMSVHTLLPGELKIELLDTTLYDEQLRMVGPNGELASNCRYSATLADGSKFEGETDAQGYTQRFVTQKPARITQLTLFPSDDMKPVCCAAQNTSAPLVIDLTSENVTTNDTDLGSSTQNVPLPEGKKRRLTYGEIAMAKTVFKNSVDYSKVKIHHGGWWLFFGFQNTAVTPNGEMYFPESTHYYKDDFSNTGDNRHKALFMHEMTHVWQYQLGYPIKKAGLTVSSRGAAAYEYTLSEQSKLSSYNMEQQGEIISDYYIICIVGDARAVWNMNNYRKSPKLLASTLESFLSNPGSKHNLPF